MKASSKSSIKSLISLILILSSLFAIAFLQMEERRQSYHLLQLNKDLKTKIEARRNLEVQRLNALRPQKIEKEIQERTALNHAQSEQIIHMPNPISQAYSEVGGSSMTEQPQALLNSEAVGSRL